MRNEGEVSAKAENVPAFQRADILLNVEMLQFTAAGSGTRFMGLVHHTDAEREWAYDRDSRVGRLDRALDEARGRGWTIVDMKQDWRDVFVPATSTGTRALQ